MYSLASADRDNKEKKRRIIYKEGLQAFGMDNACAMLTIYWATSKLLFSFLYSFNFINLASLFLSLNYPYNYTELFFLTQSLSETIQSSMRIYAEFWRNDRALLDQPCPASVAVGICNFPNEIAHYTKFSSKACYGGLKRFKYFKSGGHFCNIDSTDEVVKDLVEFVSDL